MIPLKPLPKSKSENTVHYEQKPLLYLIILIYVNRRYSLLAIYDILFVA